MYGKNALVRSTASTIGAVLKVTTIKEAKYEQTIISKLTVTSFPNFQTYLFKQYSGPKQTYILSNFKPATFLSSENIRPKPKQVLVSSEAGMDSSF